MVLCDEQPFNFLLLSTLQRKDCTQADHEVMIFISPYENFRFSQPESLKSGKSVGKSNNLLFDAFVIVILLTGHSVLLHRLEKYDTKVLYLLTCEN